MHILHIATSIDPKAGGVSQAILMIVSGLKHEGINNDIVTLDNPEERYADLEGCTVFALGPGKTNWCYSNKLIPWLNHNMGLYHAVIVHGLWQFHTYAVHSAWKKLQSPKKPKVFVMPHGMLDPWFQVAKGRKMKAFRNNIIWRLLENAVINNASGLLFTCQTELLLARESFPNYKPKSEKVVGLGIEAPPSFLTEMTNEFRKKSGLKNEEYLLFISRIHEKKGIDILIKAYLSLASTGIHLPKLVIAGPGLETSYGELIKRIAGTNENIVFVGMLTGYAKWGAFYGCEAFVLPSHQENFGIAVVEACACRKPVLISNQVNIWREIDALNGGLICNDNQADLEVLLLRWLKFSNKSEIGDNAYKAYLNNFSINIAGLKFKNVISSMIQDV